MPSRDSSRDQQKAGGREHKPRFGYTLVLVKPDAVEAGHIGEVISALELKGFRIVRLNVSRFTKTFAHNFYKEHEQKDWFGSLIRFMTSGDIVAIVAEGEDVVKEVRDLIGATDPEKAKKGTLRRRFGRSGAANAVHGSDSWESAAREIGLVFPDFDLSA